MRYCLITAAIDFIQTYGKTAAKLGLRYRLTTGAIDSRQTDGFFQFLQSFEQHLFLVVILRVAMDAVEQERDLGAVLHGGDEQIGELQAVTARVLLAKLSAHP